MKNLLYLHEGDTKENGEKISQDLSTLSNFYLLRSLLVQFLIRDIRCLIIRHTLRNIVDMVPLQLGFPAPKIVGH